MTRPTLLALAFAACAALTLTACRAHFLCDRNATACSEEPDVPSRGPATAPVVIEEFSEFQCPFCRRAQSTLRELEDNYPGKLRFVFRHFPLGFHEHADLAARAGVAALRQGRFWPFHDMLFADGRLSREDLIATAAKLELDIQQFRADLSDAGVAAIVARDVARGRDVGVTGVPHFLVNGRAIRGAQPAAAFAEIIDEELAKADELLGSGVASEDIARTLTDQNLGSAD